MGLLGEEEDESALLAAIAFGDVEVKDRGDIRRHFAVVGCAGRFIGRRLRDGDDEVWELKLAVEIGWTCWGFTFWSAAAGLQCDLLRRTRGTLGRRWRRGIDVIADRLACQACVEIGAALIFQFAAAGDRELGG